MTTSTKKIELKKDIVVKTIQEAKELFLSEARMLAETKSIKAMKADGFTFELDIHEWLKSGQPSGIFYANIIMTFDGVRYAKRFQQAPLGNWNAETGKIFKNFQYKTLATIYSVVKYNFGMINAAHYFPELAHYKKSIESESIAI